MTTTTCSRNDDACWTRFVFPRPVAGNNRSEMPRCYMVKKQCNKYQGNAREFWDEETSSNSVVPPDSPTEACVAPPYYTPLTNQSSKFSCFVDARCFTIRVGFHQKSISYNIRACSTTLTTSKAIFTFLQNTFENVIYWITPPRLQNLDFRSFVRKRSWASTRKRASKPRRIIRP